MKDFCNLVRWDMFILTLDRYLLCNYEPKVFVGISQIQEEEILKYVNQKRIKNVVYPLWFDKKILLRDE